jgi:hypothetical protein
LPADVPAEAPATPTRHATRPRRTRREAPKREVIYRHWVNALAIFLMVGSGLNIFNAHPRLYWGKTGSWPDRAAASISTMANGRGGSEGVTQLGPLHFDTTGVLGVSRVQGVLHARAWPAWITLPSVQDLADARHWHFFFAATSRPSPARCWTTCA